MPHGRRRRGTCRQCGIGDSQARISRAGYCPACGQARHELAAEQMRAGEGEFFIKWAVGWMSTQDRPGRPETPYPPDA